MSTSEPQTSRAQDGGTPPPAAAAPVLDDLREADLPEAAGFIHREASGSPASPALQQTLAARMRWLMCDNPARLSDVPFGWVLRDTSRDPGTQIVGAMMCIPQRFVCQGKQTTALMSAKWFVSEHCRGGGVGIFMRYAALAKRFPLFCTTAAPGSAALWKKFGGYEIADHDHELIGTARWGPMVEEAALRKLKHPLAARAAAALAFAVPGKLRPAARSATGCELSPIRSAADAAALALTQPADTITAVRDEGFIAWRHLACPDPEPRALLAFSSPGGARALVITQLVRRGHRAQIRALQVLDLCGQCDPADMPALAGSLARHFKGRFDVLVFRGQRAERQAALQQVGFMRRPFAAPVAWCIDKHTLLPTRSWYLVPADAE